MMHSYRFSLGASQPLNSIRFHAKGAVQLLTKLLVFSLCLFPSLATAQSPHIYDVPQAGPPGSQTQAVGNGWDSNATLDIYFDSTDVGIVDTDSNGSFGMTLRAPTIRQNGLTIQIPKDAVQGKHWITAVERITQLQAQVSFTVRLDWPQFHFDAQHTGFNPYENVLNAETVGNLTPLWEYEIVSWSNYAPVVGNGLVYPSSSWALWALDAGTGAPRWEYPTSPSAWYSAPAVANGIVYFSSMDGYLYALNAMSGVRLWRYFVKTEIWGPSPPTVLDGVVYVGSVDHVYALAAKTGALLWQYAIPFSILDAPTVADGVVYVCSPYDYNVYALDAGTGALLWKSATDNDITAAPVVANGMVYVALANQVWALKASTGALVWKYRTAGYIMRSPAVANGVVYAGTADWDRSVYALDAGTGALLWTYPTGGGVFCSPAVANGVVYVGSEDSSVYALEANTGALLWKYTTGNAVNSSPAVVNGMLYIGSDDGNLYAFGLPGQHMSETFSPPERPDPALLTPDWSLQPGEVVRSKSVESR
jgi:outer membrane protein assembly factor BamB